MLVGGWMSEYNLFSEASISGVYQLPIFKSLPNSGLMKKKDQQNL